MKVTFIEEYNGYYKITNNGNTKSRIDENAYTLTAIETEEEIQTEYEAIPIEGYVNPAVRKTQLLVEMHKQIALKNDVAWQIAKDEYDLLG